MSIKKLLKEAAALSECAFRRGYQHGYHAAKGDIGRVPTSVAVRKFREDPKRFAYASIPPHETRAAWNMPALMRMEMELANAKANLLAQLMREVSK